MLKTKMQQNFFKVNVLTEDLHPYVLLLPSERKNRTLGAIFGSKAAVDILKFSLGQGISKKIYQKDLVKMLDYSNKTVIENLKSLTKLGVLTENMEKDVKDGRIIWVKAYQLSNIGRWFALLLAEEKELSEKEKADILLNLFRTYVRWVGAVSKRLHVDKKTLEQIFAEEVE